MKRVRWRKGKELCLSLNTRRDKKDGKEGKLRTGKNGRMKGRTEEKIK